MSDQRNPSLSDDTPLLSWMAWLAPIITLVVILFGALTTTKGAGMAFPDWPSSDGHNMFLYPWFKLFHLIGNNQDALHKFLEHGHRLAGTVIGIHCIVMVIIAFLYSSRPWIKWTCVAILVLVCAQGLLGGVRVLRDDQRLAMLHGLLAAFVFSLMCFVSLATTKSWFTPNQGSLEQGSLESAQASQTLKRLRWMSITMIVLLTIQYTLGGFLRHHNKALYEHIGFAVFSLIACLVTMFFAVRSSMPWLRSSGLLLGATIVIQFALGLVTFLVKFGFPHWGIVAIPGSGQEVYMRTFHMMGGVLVMAAAFLILAKTMRLQNLQNQTLLSENMTAGVSPDETMIQGQGELT